MDRDDIAVLVDIIHIQYMVHIAAQIPRRIHRYIRIIAVNFHAQMLRRVRHPHADGAQADDAELLALQLCPGKFLFLLLCRLRDVRVVLLGLHPLDAAHHVAGCEQHTGNHKLLHAVGIRPRRVEYHDALLRALLQWDIVDAGSRPRHRQKIFRQIHLMHGRASDQNTVRLRYLVRLRVIRRKPVKPHLRDGIQAMIFIHNYLCSSSNFRMNATNASTPSFGIAL